MRSARDTPTYLFVACEYDGIRGLYGRDYLNRSPFRRKLARLGVDFARESFVVFDGNDSFRAPGGGMFVPEFVVFNDQDEDPTKVVTRTEASTLFALAAYRIGGIPTPELAHLSRVAQRIDAISAGDPRALLDAITSRRRHD